jgi:hypothetical protein
VEEIHVVYTIAFVAVFFGNRMANCCGGSNRRTEGVSKKERQSRLLLLCRSNNRIGRKTPHRPIITFWHLLATAPKRPRCKAGSNIANYTIHSLCIHRSASCIPTRSLLAVMFSTFIFLFYRNSIVIIPPHKSKGIIPHEGQPATMMFCITMTTHS